MTSGFFAYFFENKENVIFQEVIQKQKSRRLFNDVTDALSIFNRKSISLNMQNKQESKILINRTYAKRFKTNKSTIINIFHNVLTIASPFNTHLSMFGTMFASILFSGTICNMFENIEVKIL